MNTAPPRLKISSRDLVFAFVLAFIAATVIGVLVDSWYHDLDRITLPIAQLVSVLVFVRLVMLGGKQSLPDVIAATSISRKPRAGGVLLWIAVALFAGLVFRFGTGGLALGALQVAHLAWSSLPDPGPLQISNESAIRVDTILVIGTALGASIEEFTYRRILQSFFCRKYGLWLGMAGVAVAFGAVHGSLVIILVGFCLALLYVYSGRLWVAIVAHTTGNLAVPILASLQPAQRSLLICCAISAVLLVVAAVLAVRAIKRSPRIYD